MIRRDRASIVGSCSMQQLNNESVFQSEFKEEVARQKKRDFLQNRRVMGRLGVIEQEAKEYACKIELELKKKSELESIIKALEELLLEKKRKKAAEETRPQRKTGEDWRGQQQLPGSEGDTENIEVLSKRQKKLEYDTEQIVIKHNESLAQINNLKEQVNIARSERVIYSGIFKNLEKELRQQEEEFKCLLIEKAKTKKLLEGERRSFEIQEAQARQLLQVKEADDDFKEVPLRRSQVRAGATSKHEIGQQGAPQPMTQSKAKIGPKAAPPAGDQMDRFQLDMIRLKIATGMESLGQVLELVDGVQGMNEALCSETLQLNEECERLERKLRETTQALNHQRVLQHGGKDIKEEHFGEMLKAKSRQKSLQAKLEEEKKTLDEIIKNQFLPLAEQLGISLESLGVEALNEDNVEVLMLELERATGHIQAENEEEAEDSGQGEKQTAAISEVLDKYQSGRNREFDKLMSRKDFLEHTNNEISMLQAKKNARRPKKS